MGTTVIMQARMGSSRLPGKILMNIGGQPAIELELARLVRAQVDEIVLATSDRTIDDPVEELGRRLDIAVVRGSELDVLGRFHQAVEAYPNDVVIRTTGDCPFIDPAVVDEAVGTFLADEAEYCSNTLVRTYPVGLDCEVMTADALAQANREAVDPVEREHVTPFLYRRPERFRLTQCIGPQLLGRERWTLDTPDDLARLQHMATLVADPVQTTWQSLLSVAGRLDSERAVDIRCDVQIRNPETRRWLVIEDGEIVGAATIVTKTGVARLRFDLAERLRPVVRALVDEALRSDRQVAELIEEPV